MRTEDDTANHHCLRSEFVRRLVQSEPDDTEADIGQRNQPPKVVVQYWHNLRLLPADVNEGHGFSHEMFDEASAKQFIAASLGDPFVESFNRCYHPAMQSDYFRLCYLYVRGGFYVDADDVWTGTSFESLFEDARLKLNPLCYDMSSSSMVAPNRFLPKTSFDQNWIFYFNNNPLVSGARHPMVRHALARATKNLRKSSRSDLPEIQSTTGPGNLTRSVFELAEAFPAVLRSLRVSPEWESIAVSRWPLSYRSDLRNWRNCNQRHFEKSEL